MPLSINVGLSRKASRDFQSTGYSINVTAELDQSLLVRPDELQEQVAGLYSQAEQALARQAGVADQHRQEPQQRPYPERRRENGGYGGNGTSNNGGGQNGSYSRSNGHANGNGNGNGQRQGHTNGTGGMTSSQRRAINAIAQRLNVDPAAEVQDNFGWNLDQLTVKQASQVIDYMKELQSQQPSRNGGPR